MNRVKEQVWYLIKSKYAWDMLSVQVEAKVRERVITGASAPAYHRVYGQVLYNVQYTTASPR